MGLLLPWHPESIISDLRGRHFFVLVLIIAVEVAVDIAAAIRSLRFDGCPSIALIVMVVVIGCCRRIFGRS